MPFYYEIDENSPAGKRTADRLLALQQQLASEVPKRTISDTLLLATWNIREFDSSKFGERTKESFYYIAEIISHFDIVAVQEVRKNLEALNHVNDILGGWWSYVVTDVTVGGPGNKERMAFLYDSRKVRFGGLSGEIVMPPKRGKDGVYTPANQLARTPYLVGFKSSWYKFMLCTVHILYGKAQPDDPRRIKEIKMIADFLVKLAHDKDAWSPNLILLGDFNIFSVGDPTFEALVNAGFHIPQELQSLPPTNIGKKARHYDQIAFLTQKDLPLAILNAGVFNFYKSVFRDEDEQIYKPEMGAGYTTTSSGKPRSASSKKRYYPVDWRTHQMSDHLPMWVELKIDFGKEYLEEKAGE